MRPDVAQSRDCPGEQEQEEPLARLDVGRQERVHDAVLETLAGSQMAGSNHRQQRDVDRIAAGVAVENGADEMGVINNGFRYFSR